MSMEERFRFVSRSTNGINSRNCIDALLECGTVIDTKCHHVCENEIFHRVESCLVPHYALLREALRTAMVTSSAATCILYDADGYLSIEGGMLQNLLLPAWQKGTSSSFSAASRIIPVPYHALWPKSEVNYCWKEKKTESSCFLVRNGTSILSTLNNCASGVNHSCDFGRTIAERAENLRNDLFNLWGLSTKGTVHSHRWRDNRNNTLESTDMSIRPIVVLIDRPNGKNRADARVFSDTKALISALELAGMNVHVYTGSTSTFSVETARLFGAADLVLGYHGAGCINLLYSSQGTACIELYASRGTNSSGFVSSYNYSTGFASINKRIADWGLRWKDLAVGFGQGGNPTKSSRWFKFVKSIEYDDNDLHIIVQAVLDMLDR